MKSLFPPIFASAALLLDPFTFAAQGDLDVSFGTKGKVTTGFDDQDYGYGMVVQSDGKIIAVGEHNNGSNDDFALARFTSAGVLDTTFNTNGKVTTAIGSKNDGARAVALQADGKIVVAGYSHNGTNYDFALVRYNTNGTLDTTFNTTGKVATAIGTADDYATSVAIQSDGKIVVSGDSYSGGYSSFAVVRYNSNGTLDATFNTTGKVTTAIGSADDLAEGLVIQADGKLLVAGSSYSNVTGHWGPSVVRYNTNGTLDTTFGGTGKAFLSVGTTDAYGHAIALQSDGKVVLAGQSWNGTNWDMLTLRLLTDGSNDTTFNSVSYATLHFGYGDDMAYAVAVQSDGKIVVAGRAYAPFGWSFGIYNTMTALVRYNSSGTLDTTFSSTGKLIYDANNSSFNPTYSPRATWIASLVIQGDGQLVVAGTRFANNSGGNPDFCVQRFSSTGSNNKDVLVDFTTNDFRAAATSVQADGKMVVVGDMWNGSASTSYDFAIARYNANGTLDTTFNGGLGWQSTGIANAEDHARSVAIQGDGKIVVAGDYYNGTNYYYMVERFNADGSYDTSFGTGGAYYFGAGTVYGTCRGVAVQSDGKIVLAGYYSSGGFAYFLVVRVNANGTLDTGFNGTGYQTTGFTATSNDYATALALQSDGKIVVGGYSNDSGRTFFAAARYTSVGALDTTFNGTGKVTTAIGSSSDSANSVAIQSDGKILLGGQTYNSASGYDFGLVRYNATGTLDTTFNGTGKVTTDIGSGTDGIASVMVLGNGKIVAAGDTNGYGSGTNDMAVLRYNANGSLDTTFGPSASGTGFAVLYDMGSGNDFGQAVALSGASIVVAGQTNVGGHYNFALARFEADPFPAIAVEAPAGTPLADGGNTISFAANGSTQVFTVRSAGTASLQNLALSIDGANAGDFLITTGLGATTLAAGASTTFTIAFTPTAAGTRTAALHIASNDATRNPFDVTLSGTLTLPPAAEAWRNVYSGSGNGSDVVDIPADFTGPGDAQAVAVDAVGNVYAIGSLRGASNYDYVTLKYNAAGVLQWAKTYNGPGNGDDKPGALAIDGGGNVYVTGQSKGNGTGIDYATIKYDSAGNQLWVTRYAGPGIIPDDKATCVVVDGVGSVYVTGSSPPASSGSQQWATIKYNSAGVQQWLTRSAGTAQPLAMAVDSNGNVYVAGNGNAHYATAKYDANGTEQWLRTYNGGSISESARGIAVDAAGNVYVTGNAGPSGNTDFTTIKYDNSGTQKWVASYNGPGNGSDSARSIALDSSGNVYVAGASGGWATVKYNSAGAQLWVARNETSGSAYDLAVDALGNAYVTGSIGNDIGTISYDGATGAQRWLQQVPYNTSAAQGVSIAVNGSGRVGVLASYAGPTSGSDLLVLSYTQAGLPQAASPLATSVGVSSAILNGTVAGSGTATTATFEYGLTTAYGSTATATFSPNDSLTGKPATATITGLSQGTTYHYRLVASNSLGVSRTADATFTTDAPPVLTPVAITSNNANPAWARLGNTVTLSFTANEAIQTPSVSLLGTAATVANPSGNNWTATATVGAGTAEGTAAFSITATDLAGNTAAAVTATTNGSSVKVDKTTPTLGVPANITAEATSAAGSAVTFSASATDNLDAAPAFNVAPASGSTFAIGTTTVNLSSTDAAGNTANGSFTVTVRDTTAPVVAAHANVTVEATSAAGAVVTYAAGSASDAVGVTSLAYSQDSGTLFPIGTATVTITAKDAANNTGTGTFTVTVLSFQQSWRQLFFGTSSNTGNASDNADPDGDGLPNLLEWACNLNPTTSSTLNTATVRNGATFEFTYTRGVVAVNAGAIFTVEWSDSLPGTSWSSSGVTEQLLSDNGTVQQVKALVPAGSQGRRFVHLNVTPPP